MMGTPAKSEYQHFVPQFLLRNFSHPYKPAGPKKRGKRKDDNGIYFNELVVRNVDLTADPPVICEKPVKRILGEMNMYEKNDDPSSHPIDPKTQRSLERMLGDLENKVAAVFRKITKAYQEDIKAKAEGSDFGPASVEMTRGERDLIRKFLFILKYRAMRFHKRFYHDTAEDYNENDRELLLEYMAEKGYTKPVDVWHDNIKAIIEVEMDTRGLWKKEIRRRMYHMDAEWFISHTEFYYMAICTPSSPDEEFILTDNSYNIFEGPNTFVRDQVTGLVQPYQYAPLHMFAPVSPKLMIVLRSMTFPNPLEDADKTIKEFREQVRKVVLEDVYHPGMLNGLLNDLPVSKAQNSYSRVVNGRYEWIGEGHSPGKYKHHKFYFTIFPLPSKYVHTISTVLFDNASYCSSIVFNGTAAFTKTLEWFLMAPNSEAKTVTGYDQVARGKLFDKLETISKSLGLEMTMNRRYLEVPTTRDFAAFLKQNCEKHRLIKAFNLNEGAPAPVLEGLDRILSTVSDFQILYESLGGSENSIGYDFEQAERMWTLRVKIDSWSQGIDESIRRRNRDLLNEAYCKIPPARYFVFSKLCRIIIASIELSRGHEYVFDVDGPDDVIARVHHIVRRDRLNWLIYNAMQSYVKYLRGHRLEDMWEDIVPGFEGFMRVVSISLMIEGSGYIRECGIPEVEDLARQAQRRILRENIHHDDRVACSALAFLEDDNRIELLTRALVRADFVSALEGKVERPLLLKLENVMFNLAYPTPPREEHRS
ncbi:hypothetical protein QBC34DRAFT_83855 [Podospora aff. communis PSN243]|uniref:FHA domain-containing protein n=1 Tax=Podospora aff. communis PSN243 TaxID=3040156 RepID=A0AAV9GNR7_9PEZI|nr:hypothetical protein QBC34DRAFT_83855 [Podospora aff. communis PSN243]